MALLIGTLGDRALRIPLEGHILHIGRGAHNDIDLADRSVSRNHAELVLEQDHLRLRDLGSSNGTWVNERRIAESTELKVGDRVRFGGVTLFLAADSASVTSLETGAALLTGAQPSLAPPGEINTRESVSWDQARSDLASSSRLSHMLLKVVTEAGQVLVLPRPLNETFDLVLGLVERIIPSRHILLLLTDTPDGSPVIRAARPEGQPASEQLILSHTIVATVLHDRQALLLNDVQSDPRFAAQQSIIAQNLRSAMVAPLFDNQQVIGLLYADSDDPRAFYDRDQLRAFTLLANLIAVKITNARLLESQREKERMEQEVAAAANVQQALLRGTLPQIPGYELAVRQVPCFEVGGDLYDVTPLEDGRIALVVGDVTGKGMGAALLMSNVLAGLRVLYQENALPSVLASRLDRQLLRSSDETHYVTLFLGLLDPQTHVLEYVNAGHNPPLLFSEGDRADTLDATGVPLGLLAGSHFSMGRVVLPPGGLLCVFSDGIPEAMVGEDLYGDERLIEGLCSRRTLPLAQIVQGTFDDLAAFVGEEQRLSDDVTLLLLRRI